jgi:hypothetical protein
MTVPPAPVSLNIESAIEAAPLGHHQVRIIAICAVVAMLDGFDAQALAYVAPMLLAQWGMGAGSFAPAFSVGLAGLALGALLFGTLADRIGRKPVVLIAVVVLYGVSSLLTAFIETFGALLLLRFVTGLGIGGSLPTVIALTSECMPKRHRATVVGIMISGFPLGVFCGGALASHLVPVFGWESVFFVGGGSARLCGGRGVWAAGVGALPGAPQPGRPAHCRSPGQDRPSTPHRGRVALHDDTAASNKNHAGRPVPRPPRHPDRADLAHVLHEPNDGFPPGQLVAFGAPQRWGAVELRHPDHGPVQLGRCGRVGGHNGGHGPLRAVPDPGFRLRGRRPCYELDWHNGAGCYVDDGHGRHRRCFRERRTSWPDSPSGFAVPNVASGH